MIVQVVIIRPLYTIYPAPSWSPSVSVSLNSCTCVWNSVNCHSLCMSKPSESLLNDCAAELLAWISNHCQKLASSYFLALQMKPGGQSSPLPSDPPIDRVQSVYHFTVQFTTCCNGTEIVKKIFLSPHQV